MRNDPCQALRLLPGADFDDATRPFRRDFEPLIATMERVLAQGDGMARCEGFAAYALYCRWPVRMLEYSFAMQAMAANTAGRRILDVGSGMTPWPYWMAAAGGQITAVDLIAEEVRAMQRHGRDTYGHAVRHLVGDGRALAFESEQFDAVSCISVIEHMPRCDVGPALAELLRVCRPGGRMVLTTDALAADTPFTAAHSFTVESVLSLLRPLAVAAGAEASFTHLAKALRTTTFAELETFWTAFAACGLWAEANRGYHPLGICIDLPTDTAAKAQLAETLAAWSDPMGSAAAATAESGDPHLPQSETARLRAQIATLTEQLERCEADRAARLEAIEWQQAQLDELRETSGTRLSTSTRRHKREK